MSKSLTEIHKQSLENKALNNMGFQNFQSQDRLELFKKLSNDLSQEDKKKYQRENPKCDYGTLRFMASNAPSSSQCTNKICESILSDGIKIVPAKSGRKSAKERAELEKIKYKHNLEYQLASYTKAYLTYGDGYLYPVMSEDGKSIADIKVLETDKTKILVDKDVLMSSGIYVPRIYQYIIKDERRGGSGNTEGNHVNFEPDDVIRWRRPGLDPVYGTAVLEDEISSVMFGIRIVAYNLRFFGNSAKPPLIVHLSEGTKPEEALAYKRYLDNNYKGSSKAWESLISYGGTKFQELQLPDQTSFMDFLTYARIQVCGLYGVPPFEIGVVDKSGLNNTETQHKDFIKTNINKKKIELENILNYGLLPKTGVKDWKFQVPLMDAVNEKQRIELNALALASGQMTVNEARKRNNLESYNEAWADVPVAGDPKRNDGLMPLGEMIDDGARSSAAIPEKQEQESGRPDMDGRPREDGDSINDQ